MPNKIKKTSRSILLFFMCILLSISFSGCGKKEQPKPAGEADSDKDKEFTPPPELNDEGDKEEGFLAATRMVNEEAGKSRKADYIPDEAYPTGIVQAKGFVKLDKKIEIPGPYPIFNLPEAHAVPTTILNPGKGEKAFYTAIQPRRTFLLGNRNGRDPRFPVGDMYLIFGKVPVGKKMPLNPLNIKINPKSKLLELPHRYGAWTSGVAPKNTRILITNEALYDAHIIITRGNPDDVKTKKEEEPVVGFYSRKKTKPSNVVFECKLPRYHDPKHPGHSFGQKFGMAQPPMIQSPVMREAGLYKITNTRHPWQVFHVWVVENPYVLISRKSRGHVGRLEARDLPPGKYPVRVWHPEFKPKKPRIEVEILRNQVTELAIEFEVPELLSDPIPLPKTPVTHWAFAGPLEPDGDLVFPPEKGVDLKATYSGKDEVKVIWQFAETNPKDRYCRLMFESGKVTLLKKPGENYSFAYAELESPKAQPILFGAYADRSVRLWLNGTLISGHERSFLAGGRLKKGKNTILTKVRNYGGGHAHVGVRYMAEGVKVVELGK